MQRSAYLIAGLILTTSLRTVILGRMEILSNYPA
jgi:hypothetical protein